MFSFMIIFAGAANIIMGNFSGGNLSDSFYDSFPEARRSGKRQMNAGIAVLVIGIILMTLSFAWCCYARRHLSNMPTTFSGTAMTTTVVAPNAASTPGLVQPPIIQGGGGGGGGQQTFVYSYQSQQQAGSFQPVQIGTNQYPPAQPVHSQYLPAQPAFNQYPPAQPTLQPSAPVERLPDQPPPSYNELTNPTSDATTCKSYGNF